MLEGPLPCLTILCFVQTLCMKNEVKTILWLVPQSEVIHCVLGTVKIKKQTKTYNKELCRAWKAWKTENMSYEELHFSDN